MSKVFFLPISSNKNKIDITSGAAKLFQYVINEQKISLSSYLPLKVHFGEKKNKTFLQSDNYLGLVNYLESNNIDTAYIETNALYSGERQNRTAHKLLAEEHGFTQIPVIIADGEYGDEFEFVPINGTYFDKCFIAKEIANLDQMIILSHFKGHLLAGFGGAIKQLAMGCASRGGKLAQHSNTKPKIKVKKCELCEDCLKTCPADAIHLNPKPMIDDIKCIGCASCMAVCMQKAVSMTWWGSVTKKFREKIVESAFAAQKGKEIIYINFLLNITRGCDCEARKMKAVVPDVGILASTDPVSIDTASLDLTQKMKGRKIFNRGRCTLEYAEKFKLGTPRYELIEIKLHSNNGR
jgi:uncharacterized Fe-S center protein